jgi:hypothetical protein
MSEAGTNNRRLRQVLIDLSIMAVIGVVVAVIGPFGSYSEPLALRLAYWLGLAFAGFAIYRPIGAAVTRMGKVLDFPEPVLWLVACLIATIPMSIIVWSLAQLGGAYDWPTPSQALETYGSVLIVGGGVTEIFYMLGTRKQVVITPEPAQVPASIRFLDRLPPALGSDLLALEMEDHYVRAHTALGSDLILMRMRDAVAELGGLDGAQVHRSWWVARSAVEEVLRDGRNIRLVLGQGLEAPVARNNIAELKAAGWF